MYLLSNFLLLSIAFLRRALNKIFILLMCACSLVACKPATPQKQVGIILPIAHQSLNNIVDGFVETLKQGYPGKLNIRVLNAQGDINIQRAIIQQMKNDRVDLIVPIATAPTQMAAAMIANRPIIGLAAQYAIAAKGKTARNLNVVSDEVPPKNLLNFMQQAYPQIKRITLLYSPSDKIYADVQQASIAAKSLGISLNTVMVPTLQDLYTITKNLPDTQAIIALKDVMLISGIATLVQAAEKRGILLITSDEGSVHNGANFALGVQEHEIGKQGALMALKILSGKSISDLPHAKVNTLSIFINKKSLQKNNFDAQIIEKTAKQLHYPVITMGEK